VVRSAEDEPADDLRRLGMKVHDDFTIVATHLGVHEDVSRDERDFTAALLRGREAASEGSPSWRQAR
jgi:hypothetical protein